MAIRRFAPGDPAAMSAAFTAVGWHKPVELFERYLDEHAASVRYALLAEIDGDFAGYVTLVWRSEYRPFAKDGVPEVSDLNVIPHHRRVGIATRLLDAVERIAAKRSPVVGLGVGLYADYGAAQRTYVRRGYVPDGRGMMYANEPVRAGESVSIDDDATFMFVKDLASGGRLREA